MTSTTETGHAKNVANLNELVTCVTGFGSAYNPSKGGEFFLNLGLSLTAMNVLATLGYVRSPAEFITARSREYQSIGRANA